MTMRHRETSTERSLLVNMGTADDPVGTTKNVAEKEFRLVGDITRLKKPSYQRNHVEQNAGNTIVPKLTTRQVGEFRFTVQTYNSELIAAVGRLEAGGTGTATASTPDFLIREYAVGNDGAHSLTLTEIEGVITLYDPQEVGPGEPATAAFVVLPTKLYAVSNKRDSGGASITLSGLTRDDSDLYYNINTGRVWQRGVEVTLQERTMLGLPA